MAPTFLPTLSKPAKRVGQPGDLFTLGGGWATRLQRQMDAIEEILSAPAAAFNNRATWDGLDKLIESVPDVNERVQLWERVAAGVEGKGASSGHPRFRLGILHLLNDPDEAAGIAELERAYEQDQRYATDREPHRRAAYCVLNLVRDFLNALRARGDWQARQLDSKYRRVLVGTLFEAYDLTVRHILDTHAWSYSPFFRLINNQGFRRFAIENYMCAQDLLEWVETKSGRSFVLTNEYPLARALIGLYGGVLEALLADKLGIRDRETLGALINRAYEEGLLPLGSRICALASIVLYFRNHIHPNKDIARTEYFINLNVARGLKAAMDLVITDLVAELKAEGSGNPSGM